MSEYGLLVSFPDQSNSFTHGFEAGTIWALMEGQAQEIVCTCHAENHELILEMASHFNYSAEIEEVKVDQEIFDEYINITLRNTGPKPSKAKDKFKVIDGGYTKTYCEHTGKRKYENADEAERVAHNFYKRVKRKKRGKVSAYKCPHCGKFHWGHDRKR